MAFDEFLEREKEIDRIRQIWLSLQSICQEKRDAKLCYCRTFNKYIEIYDSRPMHERKPQKCWTCIELESADVDFGDYTDRLRKKWIEEWKD